MSPFALGSRVRRLRPNLVTGLVMFLVPALFLTVVRELFILQILTFVFIFAIYAQSWNLMAHWVWFLRIRTRTPGPP